MRFQIEQYVQAPTKHVFDVFTDFQRLPERSKHIESIDILTAGEIDVGTRYRLRFKGAHPGFEASQHTITHFDRPRRYSEETTTGHGKTLFLTEFIPQNEGTLIRLTSELRPKNLLLWPRFFLFKILAKAEIKRAIDQEKQFLELMASICENSTDSV